MTGFINRAERLGGTTDRLLAGRAEALFVLNEIEAGDSALAGVRRISDARVALARAVRFLSTDDAGNKTLDAKVALNEPCPFCGQKHVYQASELSCPFTSKRHSDSGKEEDTDERK